MKLAFNRVLTVRTYGRADSPGLLDLFDPSFGGKEHYHFSLAPARWHDRADILYVFGPIDQCAKSWISDQVSREARMLALLWHLPGPLWHSGHTEKALEDLSFKLKWNVITDEAPSWHDVYDQVSRWLIS